MCLGITLRAAGIDRKTSAQLALAHPLLHRPRFSSTLYVHGCELLTDDADWGAATWDMTRQGRQQLADAFDALFAAYAGQVAIEALWEGDKATTQEALSREQLLAKVRENEVGTKTRYLVRSD
jgi:hypothetical protein